MNLDHQFDWKGFRFSVGLVAYVVVAGMAGQYGFPYAWAYAVGPAMSASVAVQSPAPPVAGGASQSFSTSTSERVISSLSIKNAVPQARKFVAADLVNMKMYLYDNGATVAEYPILTKGRPNSPYEAPSGFYEVLTKEQNHFNKGAQVYLPYSMQFYGNYFIHGWPYHLDGTLVDPTYSGGCIRLSTADAERVYAFVDKGTSVFIYDSHQSADLPSLALGDVELPPISAASYLVADIDTGDVLLEQGATTSRPIASVTKLMTALVANETIMFDREISVPRAILLYPPASTTSMSVQFSVGDLLYPLLMESNNAIAAALADYYGSRGFIGWMNTTARALDMASTSFADASGISPENISTTEDLYRLAIYLTNKKSFIWGITRTRAKTLAAPNGATFTFNNFNEFSSYSNFVGGKTGHTGQAQDTMVSVFATSVDGVSRRVAIIVLKSADYTTDTSRLADWFTQSVAQGVSVTGAACVSCAAPPTYRKISL